MGVLLVMSVFGWLFGFGAPPQDGKEAPPVWTSMVPMVLLLVILYVLLIRPQQRKAKEHRELVARLRVGDRVVTSGGVMGTVVSLKDRAVAIRSADTKLEVLKSAVSEVLGRGDGGGEEKGKR